MFFWPITDKWQEAPPQPEEVRRRRPREGPYWESNSGGINAAMVKFWLRWRKKTGKPWPTVVPQPRLQINSPLHLPPSDQKTGAERRAKRQRPKRGGSA